ncbi:hypothetical protein ACFQ0G_48135 [Streptomyces chiangmaiensis]
MARCTAVSVGCSPPELGTGSLPTPPGSARRDRTSTTHTRRWPGGSPLHPLPAPVTDPEQIARLDIRKRTRLGGILHGCEHAA